MTEKMKENIGKIEALGYKVTTDDWAIISEPHISKITGKEYLVELSKASRPTNQFFENFLLKLKA